MVNKVYCAYCQKELERLVFCSPSHKVLYHRKGKGESVTPITKAPIPRVPAIPKLKIVNSVEDVKKVVQKEFTLKTCKHGAAFGLCRFGCK